MAVGATVDFNDRYLGSFEGGPPNLFVASRSQESSWWSSDWNVLNCSLYNATYDIQISSDSNRRSLPYLAGIQLHDSIPPEFSSSTRPLGSSALGNYSTIFSYLGMMEAFDRLLVGSVASELMNAEKTIYIVKSRSRFQDPHLMGILLAFTKELKILLATSKGLHTDEEPGASQWTVVAEEGSSIISLPNEALSAPTANKSLGPALEELFQNMTLSLCSDEYFLKESDEPVNITHSHTLNVYSYSQRNLLMSYGIALGLTLLASIAGCVAIFFNGASYTHEFSTILRTTSGLHDLVAKNDRTGADPLPKYLSRTRVKLGRGAEGTEDEEGRQQAPKATNERSAMIKPDREGVESPEFVSQRSVSPER